MTLGDTVEMGGGWNVRRERMGRRIERSALMLFAKERAEDVTIERLANAAGISVRTWFRYFAGRDDVLAALPMRKLELISNLVRARPAEETLVEAFSEAVAAAQEAETEMEMVLLWGIAVHRSPEPALRAMAQSALAMNGVFQAIIAERLGIDQFDTRAGALGAAFSGLVAYSYQRWVSEGGTGSLADMLAESFAVLSELR
ncbi:MAG: TetR/AcrR family transcriptional regulator [Acidimicrobiales bacterium]